MADGERQSLRIAAPLIAALLCFPADATPLVLPVGLALFALAAAAFGLREDVPGAPLLASFLALGALSLRYTLAPGAGGEALLGWIFAAFAFLVAASVHPSHLLPIAAVAAAFHGGLALWQKWVALPDLAASLVPQSAVEELARQRALEGRAFSTFSLPGHLGALAAALVPLLVAAWLEARGTRPGRRRLLAGLGLAGCLAALHASVALGGVVALVLVAGLALARGGRLTLLARRAWPALALSALVAVAAIATFSSRLPDLLVWSSHMNPVATRLRLWRHALSVLAEAPVWGRGLGSYPVAWLRFAAPGDVPARNAHMSYVEVAAELGLPALVLLLLFFRRALRRARAPAAALAAAVLLVHAAFDFDLQSPGLRAATFALLGLAVAAGEGAARTASPSSRLGLAALALVACALASRRELGRPPLELGTMSVPVRAEALAGCLRQWPWDARARGERAAALLEAERLEEALGEALEGRRLEPATPWLAALEGDIRVARREAFAAYFAYRDAATAFPARAAYQEQASAVAARIETGRPAGGEEPSR